MQARRHPARRTRRAIAAASATAIIGGAALLSTLPAAGTPGPAHPDAVMAAPDPTAPPVPADTPRPAPEVATATPPTWPTRRPVPVQRSHGS